MNTVEVNLQYPITNLDLFLTNDYVQMKESVELFESEVVIKELIQKLKMVAVKPEVRVYRISG